VGACTMRCVTLRPAMTPAASLRLRQTQRPAMTAELAQAIKLLQLSADDLAAYVQAELERNPLLERLVGGQTGPASSRPKASVGPPAGGPRSARPLSVPRRDAKESGEAGEGHDVGAPAVSLIEHLETQLR